MHCIDKFRQELQHHIATQPTSHQQVADFAAWLKNEGILLFSAAFKEETGRPIPSLPDDKLIEQAYPKGLNELDKKAQQQAFYSANARIFVTECESVAKTICQVDANSVSDYFSSHHFALLRNLALDAQVLLADWAKTLMDVPGMYGIGKTRLHSAFQISHAADQLVYGGSPYFSFSDNATDAGIALLRVCIETRLRFGFGVLGVLDKNTQAISPLNLSLLLEAIEAHEASMTLAVPLQHIQRLYGWSNIYVHVGLKHYFWSPIFALRYLNRLLRGGRYPGGSGVDAGIMIDQKTLQGVVSENGKNRTLRAGSSFLKVCNRKAQS